MAENACDAFETIYVICAEKGRKRPYIALTSFYHASLMIRDIHGDVDDIWEYMVEVPAFRSFEVIGNG